MRVSVLVPTYNRPAMLRAALWSLQRQTGRSFEVLILNDGGEMPAPPPFFDDVTVRVCNLPHAGQSAALNAGLALARGTYVTVAQDDDLVLPEKLAVLIAALDAAEMDTGAVYSLPAYTDEAGDPIATPPGLRRYLEAHPTVRWADVERDGLFIHGTATMYRRVALEAIGGWDPALPTAEEFDLHLRLLKAAWTFQAVDAVTVTYRQHAGGKSQVRSRRRSVLRQETLRRIYANLGCGAPAEVA
jgi:glycosyltransferase involved in cell wall biosynthesis